MFKIETNKETLQEGGSGSSFINASGVYDVTINHASIGVSKGGAEQFIFNVDYKGNAQTFYGPYYKKKDGSYNDISVRLYTTLGVIAGLKDGDEFTVESEPHKVGKDQKEVDLDVVQELTELPIKLYVQQTFSNYNGINEKLEIRGFFDSEGASAEELVAGENQGSRLAQVEEKYADAISYKDGITPEQVAEWVAGGRNKGGASATKPTATKKPGNLFKR